MRAPVKPLAQTECVSTAACANTPTYVCTASIGSNPTASSSACFFSTCRTHTHMVICLLPFPIAHAYMHTAGARRSSNLLAHPNRYLHTLARWVCAEVAVLLLAPTANQSPLRTHAFRCLRVCAQTHQKMPNTHARALGYACMCGGCVMGKCLYAPTFWSTSVNSLKKWGYRVGGVMGPT